MSHKNFNRPNRVCQPASLTPSGFSPLYPFFLLFWPSHHPVFQVWLFLDSWRQLVAIIYSTVVSVAWKLNLMHFQRHFSSLQHPSFAVATSHILLSCNVFSRGVEFPFRILWEMTSIASCSSTAATFWIIYISRSGIVLRLSCFGTLFFLNIYLQGAFDIFVVLILNLIGESIGNSESLCISLQKQLKYFFIKPIGGLFRDIPFQVDIFHGTLGFNLMHTPQQKIVSFNIINAVQSGTHMAKNKQSLDSFRPRKKLSINLGQRTTIASAKPKEQK